MYFRISPKAMDGLLRTFAPCQKYTLCINIILIFLFFAHKMAYLKLINYLYLITALAYLLLPLDLNIPMSWMSITFRPWRLLSLIMAAALGLGALLMFFLQESPKFVAERGNSAETVKVLEKIYRANGNKTEYPVSTHL
jgi:hypothetical protein